MSLRGRDLTADDVRDLLKELARRLDRRGTAATVYLVGGAAIALEYDARRATDDVDAVFTPEQTVAEVAAEMSADLDLNPKWLNNATLAFIPNGPDTEAPTVQVAENLALTVASPRYLLAMKLAAGRDRDIPDIAVLCQALGDKPPTRPRSETCPTALAAGLKL